MSASPEQPTPRKKRNWSAWLLIAVGIGCVGYYIWTVVFAPPPPPPAPEPAPSSSAVSSSEPAPPEVDPLDPGENDPTREYPENRLFITGEREVYYSGDMMLTIPRLELDHIPVIDGADDYSLSLGVGLFDYAQLPGLGNRNVSIAGHRDICNKEFYYIDTLTDGDLIYLEHLGEKYTYTYVDTKVVDDEDWSRIYIQGFSCVTLVSCHPIGSTANRMIVRGRLTAVEEIATDSSAASSSSQVASSVSSSTASASS